jgi:hypothetical protein
MKRFLLLASLLLTTPALAGSWVTLAPVILSSSGTATLPVGAQLGPVDKIRFQIDGATVHLNSLTLVPLKGDPIALRHPILLKSGESSGQISVPGPARITEKLSLAYRVSAGTRALITLRVKPMNATLAEGNETIAEGNATISNGNETIKP